MATTYKGKVTTNTAPLRIRSGPSTANKIIGRIPKGTTVTITKVVIQDGGWKWGYLTYNGISGYSCILEPGVGRWITITETLNDTPKPSTDKTVDKDKLKADKAQEMLKSKASNLVTDLLAGIVGKNTNGNNTNNTKSGNTAINGSAVQYENKRYPVMGIDQNDPNIVGSEAYYREQLKHVNLYNAPEFVQNGNNYPRKLGRKSNGVYTYDYYANYGDMWDNIKTVYKNYDMHLRNAHDTFINNFMNYNRFKIPQINDKLSRSFGHVFFLRPDLNLITHATGGGFDLSPKVKNDARLYRAIKHSPEILRELTLCNDQHHQFALLLSNHCQSFELSDEYIKSDTFQESFVGHKVPYGKHNIESRSAGSFTCTYEDDKEGHLYQLFDIWVNYISDVYRGVKTPRDKYIKEFVLDYATAAYFILTAEDGETILFWSKYYGVFPTNVPSSVYSWTAGEPLTDIKYQMQFQYAWKYDYDPLLLVEFNMASPSEKTYKYLKSYNSELLQSGTSYVGAPFIETFNNDVDAPYTFKLRFRPREDD